MPTNLATRPFLVVVGSGMDDMGELIKSELTELEARDASCQKDKKMEYKTNLIKNEICGGGYSECFMG